MQDKSQNTVEGKSFQERLNAEIASWRKEGCPVVLPPDEESNLPARRCSAHPHRVKMLDPDKDGNVKFVVDCVDGHAGQWFFSAPHAEITADAERARRAAEEAKQGAQEAITRDPSKATITITMDVKSQNVSITDSFIPNPGIGAMMALIAQKYFLDQLGRAAPAGGLIVPKPKGLIDPKTGKSLRLS